MIESRKIIHIDMDAFFASIEQRDYPDLRGKPVAVGSSGQRGVVAAASYEAREYGVFSAMASSIAKRKCPHLIFVDHRFDVYRSVSRQLRDIFHEYTDLVEPLSLDEAYLDVTENKKSIPSATLIAKDIKVRIKQETQLTASAGVSINKFLAKVASDQDKPDGLFVIPPTKTEAFVEQLPIEKFFGVGKVTAKKMHEMGIFTGKDLKKYPVEDLVYRFGKAGRYYYHIARAIDDRPVNPKRIRKSIGAERTFDEDLLENGEIISQTTRILDILMERISKANAKGKTLTLKLKYNNFELHTKSKSVQHYLGNREEIEMLVDELVKMIIPPPMGIRLIGLTLSNLDTIDNVSKGQLTLEF